MAEPTLYVVSFKELTEMLIKKEGLHEGVWGIAVKFGISGANISLGGHDLNPAAIVPILEIGIHKYDEPSSLTVDASVVNPRPGKEKGGKKKTK